MSYFNHFTFSPLVTAAATFGLGLFILLNGRWKKSLYLIFGLYSFSIAFWSLCAIKFLPDFQDPNLLWGRLLHLGAIFIPVFFIHFVFEFLEEKNKKIVFFSYLTAIIFLIFNFFTRLLIKGVINKPTYSYPAPGIIYSGYVAFFIVSTLFGLHKLFKASLTATGNKRNQIKYLFWSSLFGYTGGLKNFIILIGWEIFPIYPYGTYAIPIYVLIVTITILKYRLMGIEVILWRGFLLASAFVLALAAGYVSFYAVDNIAAISPRINAGISGVWMMTVFGLLLWRLNEAVFKKEDMSLAALKDASLEMVVFPDPVRLSAEICKRVFQTLEPTYAHIYLVDERREKYQLQYLLGEQGALKETLGSSDCIVNWFLHTAPGLLKKNVLPQKAANILFYHNIVEKWLTNKDFLNKVDNLKQTLLEIKQQMEQMQAIVIVAASYKRNLYEFLILGEKKNGFYTPGDLEILSSLSRIAAMNIRNALTIADLHTKVRDKTALIQEMAKRTVQMVVAFNRAVDAKDPYTAEHSEDVHQIGSWIAEEMNIPVTSELNFGLQLHDIGKIGIPDNVLLKTAKLTDEEFNKIKQHPAIGYEILGIMDFFKKAAEITYCHQEKYDGSGYPRGLKANQIPIEARIISVADAYHAMTSDRPYRKALAMPDVVRELLKGRLKQFDPDVVDALIRRLVKMGMVGKGTVEYIAAGNKLNLT